MTGIYQIAANFYVLLRLSQQTFIDVLYIFVFPKVCKHISIKAKHISSKELYIISMTNIIHMNLENKENSF